MPCFSLQILTLHKIHVLACIAQHLFNKARGNLAICHKKAWQSILEIDVVCATSCLIEFKDYSMHAFLA